MDNAKLPQSSEESLSSSKQLSEFSSAPVDDIPAAVREETKPKSQLGRRRRRLIWGLGGLGTLALLSLALVLWQTRSQTSPAQAESAGVAARDRPSNQNSSQAGSLTAERSPEGENAAGQDTANSAANAEETLLGHLTYAEAPTTELVPVGDGNVLLRQAAAEKFEEMVAAAKADGVNLVPLSGFRSIDEQEAVFFDVKAERGENATTRAEVSAPPGHSEHHTGYAVDLGDNYFPDADLKATFENTPAFAWLQTNAGYYSFELSFPKDNSQGVSYEPWHWRFVGDRDSLETFYRARGTTQPNSELQLSPDPQQGE